MSTEYARNDWYVVADVNQLAAGQVVETRLLGQPLRVSGSPDAPLVTTADGTALPAQLRYDHIWTSPGADPRPLPDIAEAAERDRTFVPCGGVRVRCSPLRAVENFLDIAHFPFVHTGILGEEPHTEVAPYKVEIREDVDEVWATQIGFHQPQAAKSATEAIETRYEYRVPAPTTAVLYKTCPPKPEAWDVIAIFVQPLAENECIAWPWMALYDEVTPYADLVQFQQEIFLQDRSILENQKPTLLPLDPRLEIPTRCDLTSVVYRRWLKRKGATYGALTTAA
ncbi:aromatic ring-hydroxylating dioxygenase subunit alpha [uncultured Roseobacter sp.]|uniref:aromatic ring-hydroxylating oxygenase subunit alpha n=1 Tax=uncultured Roseobacter sp. TaxID=114847 RepID=UPI0026338B6E|nr:aromatic ring-hydroxylating dioxygenase subunit alpha [uncultured Roseobacter sp.]